MKVNGNEILQRLSAGKKDDRKKVSLYLSESLFADFKKLCERGGISASQVMEDLMKQFNESTGKKQH